MTANRSGLSKAKENTYSKELLNKDNLFNDHPRKGVYKEAVKMMMPFWLPIHARLGGSSGRRLANLLGAFGNLNIILGTVCS